MDSNKNFMYFSEIYVFFFLNFSIALKKSPDIYKYIQWTAKVLVLQNNYLLITIQLYQHNRIKVRKLEIRNSRNLKITVIFL